MHSNNFQQASKCIEEALDVAAKNEYNSSSGSRPFREYTGLLIKVLEDQQNQIDTLEQRIAELESNQ